MKDQFIEKAKDWDKIEWKIKLANEAYVSIKKNINIHKEHRLVDIGGGTGLLSLKFAGQVKDITVVDTSKSMLNILEEKIKTYSLKNINIIEDYFTHDTFKKKSIDTIISMMTLHHIPDIQDFFLSIYKVLKIGGSIGLIDLESEPGDFHMDGVEYYHNGFNINKLKKILQVIGFKQINIKANFIVNKKSKYDINKNYPILFIHAIK